VIGKGYDSRRGATSAMHAAVKSERNGLRHKPAQTRGKSFMLRYGWAAVARIQSYCCPQPGSESSSYHCGL